jgi:hypothetical protein
MGVICSKDLNEIEESRRSYRKRMAPKSKEGN